ncbi:MAG: AAA family ATPase [Candidatus Xenobia bacterium]
MDIEARVHGFGESQRRIKAEIQRRIVGQSELIDNVLITVIAGGHVLLEGVPGLGKTLLIRTLSEVLDLSFSRIQFTPDLMPADIVGTNMVVEEASGRAFRFQPGAVFAHLVLADEINRATPKTQSALLEAMQEHSVTVAGTRHPLPEPFFVMATQNPIEMEGTYPLPEAQVDRFFFKLVVTFPNVAELVSILDRTTGEAPVELDKVADGPALLEMRNLARDVLVAERVKTYIAQLILASHPEHPLAVAGCKKFLRYGASPRAAQTLTLAAKVHALMDGRFNVAFDDVKAVALHALRHRLILNFEGEAEGIPTASLVEELVKEVDHEKSRLTV